MSKKSKLASGAGSQSLFDMVPQQVRGDWSAAERSVMDQIDEAMAIEMEDARRAGALGFMARSLAQVTLPHSATPGPWYERSTGLVTLSITASKAHGLPYGMMPRILLAWICTEAVRTKMPHLVLGKSYADFLRKLDLHTGGTYTTPLKNQTMALLRSHISFEYKDKKHSVEGFENILIARRGFTFWNEKNPEQASLWESFMVLDQEFFESIIEAPVPVDMRVIHKLRQSPLALDIYVWLVYRIFVLRRSRRPLVDIPWGALQRQFGTKALPDPIPGESPADYKDRLGHAQRNFRTQFVRRLRQVLEFYPDAKSAIDTNSSHLTLRPCRLHIAYTGDAPLIAMP